ncbi:methyltransferase family protein [Ruania albidiflava]|uniref:methyltransferase family protein n=1 Tax=Ruania albidiflava TaxID=366586 RepID=UPI0004165323|nr:isoprenylcysteine carboxylmethyltransferase family protein [Ruania albidiflava]
MTTSSPDAEAPTGMVPIPPVLFGLAATGQRMLSRRRKRSRDEESGRRHPGAAGPRRPDRSRRRGCRCSGGRKVLSVGVAGASVALLAAGASELTEAGTSLDARTPGHASALVTSGVFARTRNPLYLGLTGLLVAHALWLGSKRALLPAGVFLVVIDRYQVPAEEAALAEKFGKAYRTYTETVPRWLLR